MGVGVPRRAHKTDQGKASGGANVSNKTWEKRGSRAISYIGGGGGEGGRVLVLKYE